MADQGLWFKLWCSASTDPDLSNLDLADFGRFCKLGLLVKSHGTAGTLTLRAPAVGLCALFQVADFAQLHTAVSRLPHVMIRGENGAVSSETVLTVTFSNWVKYQGDFSTPRVARFREMKRSRREEMRRDEMRREEKDSKTTTLSGSSPDGAQLNGRSHTTAKQILEFLNHKAGRNYQPTAVNLDFIRARLAEGATVDQCRAIIGRKATAWKGDEKMAQFLRPATLFNRTKFAQYLGELPATAFQEAHNA